MIFSGDWQTVDEIFLQGITFMKIFDVIPSILRLLSFLKQVASPLRPLNTLAWSNSSGVQFVRSKYVTYSSSSITPALMVNKVGSV